jgi:hypothetical protein
MSDELDWDFSGPDDAKAEIRAAVGYLLKGAAGSDCGDIVREIIAIVNEVARGLLLVFQNHVQRPAFPNPSMTP